MTDIQAAIDKEIRGIKGLLPTDKEIRALVDHNAPELAALLPRTRTGFRGTRFLRRDPKRIELLTVSKSPEPSRAMLAGPQRDPTLPDAEFVHVAVNLDQKGRPDFKKVEASLAGQPLSSAGVRKAIRADIAAAMAATLIHELAHAAIIFDESRPQSDKVVLLGPLDESSVIARWRQFSYSAALLGKPREDVESLAKNILAAEGSIPDRSAVRLKVTDILNEKFAANEGQGRMGRSFSNIDLATGMSERQLRDVSDLAIKKKLAEDFQRVVPQFFDALDSGRKSPASSP